MMTRSQEAANLLQVASRLNISGLKHNVDVLPLYGELCKIGRSSLKLGYDE